MKKKRRKIKFELVFCCISFMFLLLIFLFYGFKIFVNSKKYNDNDISNIVIKNKTISKDKKFRGKDVNNYRRYSIQEHTEENSDDESEENNN